MKNYNKSGVNIQESLLYTLIKPNQTFRKICEHENYFFRPAIALLVLSSFFLIIPISLGTEISIPTNELGYILDFEIQAVDKTINILSGFLGIVMIYYVGRVFKGSKNFRKVFSVYSYSLIPILIGGLILSSFMYYPFLFEMVSGIDSDELTFVWSYWMMYVVVITLISVWSFILTIKGLKIVHDFGTGKTFGIIILSSIIIAFIVPPIIQLSPIDHPYFELIQNRG